MIQKSEWRWKPDELATIPTIQLLAIFAAPKLIEQDALLRVNAIRERKGLPPLKSLTGSR